MYAAHLYDAVLLYATALGATLRQNNLTDPAKIIEAAKDGKSLFQHIIRDRKYDSKSFNFLFAWFRFFLTSKKKEDDAHISTWLSEHFAKLSAFLAWLLRPGVTGASIRIDDNGDSEGNYTVLAVKFSNVSRAININKMAPNTFYCHYEMVPVGRFDYTNSTTPVEYIRPPWLSLFCKKTQHTRNKTES